MNYPISLVLSLLLQRHQDNPIFQRMVFTKSFLSIGRYYLLLELQLKFASGLRLTDYSTNQNKFYEKILQKKTASYL
tara:strand:- start:17 stop:247 length:231 start_codon:yes stop_codon:yes gene_type:complete